MTDSELRGLVKTLRDLGVTRYRCEGVELELGAEPQSVPTTPEDAPVKMEDLIGKEPSPEDLLNWSVAGPLPSEVKYEPPKE